MGRCVIPSNVRGAIVSHLSVREAERRWAELRRPHKEKNKALIMAGLEQVERKRHCVVLGAGPCFDIPLRELHEGFERVTLVDIDHEAMQEAVRGLSPRDPSSVECVEEDITGGVGTISSQIYDAIRRGSKARKVVNGIVRIMDRAEVSPEYVRGIQADYIVSSMVLSQLANPLKLAPSWHEQRFSKNLIDSKRWASAYRSFAERIQLAHLRALRSRGGAIIFLSTDCSDLVSERPIRWSGSDGLYAGQTFLYPLAIAAIDQIRQGAVQSDQWLWQRSAPDPELSTTTYRASPVLGMVFRPADLD